MARSADGTNPVRPGATLPPGYDPSGFPGFAVTVDIVILTVRDGVLHVLLVRRKADPFAGAWALPGGFKQPDESLDEAAARELAEETAVAAPGHLSQFHSYGDPDRDPRTNVVTVAYLAVAAHIGEVAAGTDAEDARVWSVHDVLHGDIELAFDHSEILSDAIDVTARELEQTGLAPTFLGPTFTLGELQGVYEAVWGTPLDPANFRRSLGPHRTGGFVEPTGERAEPGERGGRPPELYRPGDAWRQGSPLRRPRTSAIRRRQGSRP